MREKSVVLLSGGLDSVVNFKKAFDDTDIALVLNFDYGQQAAVMETTASRDIANAHSAPFRSIPLRWMTDIDKGLTSGDIPDYDPAQLDNLDYANKTAKAVWVPNRNGVMINIAASFAEALGARNIVVGFNKEEGATFPDNTPEYLMRVNRSLEYSTLVKPKVVCYTIDMVKTEIVGLGRQIGAPFEYLWSCYHGGGRMCGKCESCRRLLRALDVSGFADEFKKINRYGFNS
ncbi:MAG: 7-cyano-7-deazaguanine synthase QueC [Spirochaetes bacterium GWF1_51_8]|nr:MAG: 7-cyano-7-deazaguanine synthase QueC [Spirochaetes bacterium GWF1_51_8]